jgi:GNAT superfamily N-acetyltransferase
MQEGDEVGAEDVWSQAYGKLLKESHLPVVPRTPELIEMIQRRMRYLLRTDPRGSWVAEAGAQIVGIAQAHIRGEIWVLATLGVLPSSQDGGIGRELLRRTLAYGDSASPGAIFCSPDPRAVHRYISAGFDLHPTSVAYGPARAAVPMPVHVREGTLDDMNHVCEVDRRVRGSDRGSDVDFQLSLGYHLLIDDNGGYAVVRHGRVAMLSALGEEVATDLLVSAIARCPTDLPVDVSWITPEQQWAVRAISKAGVPIHIHGAIMMRNDWQPRLPYLPNGIFG